MNIGDKHTAIIEGETIHGTIKRITRDTGGDILGYVIEDDDGCEIYVAANRQKS